MRKWINTGIVVGFWIICFINGTGLDATYRIIERVRIGLLILSIVIILLENWHGVSIKAKRSELFTFFGMIAVFFVSSFLRGKGMQPFEYLYAFLVVFLISKLKLDESDFKRIGLCIGAAGFAVLFIYDRMTKLSGWNENSIAMIGFFSYLIFLISRFNVKSKKAKAQIVFTAVVVSFFLNQTNSRSCILFMAVAIILALGFIDRSFFVQKKTTRFILLLPLCIAIPIASLSATSIARNLDVWSLTRYKKTFFNGRDLLWARGFGSLPEHLLLGNGNLMTNNWHNSAMHVLTTYGIAGYLFWLGAFDILMSKAGDYLGDYLVQGCLICFLIIYAQQSVELGLVSIAPNLIPYMMLGMMLGRIRYLRDAIHVEA